MFDGPRNFREDIMLTRTLLPALFVTIAAYGLIRTPLSASAPNIGQAQATESLRPRSWPNLNILKFRNGKTCGINGSPKGLPERAAQNRLRNRYDLPDNGFESWTLADLLELPQGTVDAGNGRITYP